MKIVKHPGKNDCYNVDGEIYSLSGLERAVATSKTEVARKLRKIKDEIERYISSKSTKVKESKETQDARKDFEREEPDSPS